MKETKTAAASPEARAALHDVMSAFEAYKAANDGRLAEIEAKGAADALWEEKVARIDSALAEAEARMTRLGQASRRPALAEAAVRGVDERKAAFDGYVRTGAVVGLELKGLSEGTTTAGGYVAPPELERTVMRRLQQASPMREIATVLEIGAGVYQKPVSTSGLVANWATETAARTGDTTPPVLDLLSFPAADLYAAPAATQALLDDSAVNIDEWLAEEVQDAFAAQESAAFVGGDGVNKPKGFLSYTTVADASQTWGQVGYIATGVAGAFPASAPADKMLDLIYAPRAAFRPNGRFVMNRRTVAQVRKFKDNNGDYILNPPTQPGQTASIFGFPVTEIETMPDVGANAFAVAFGDFAKGYLIVDRLGLRVLRDPYSAKPYVLFYTLKRVGGGVQNFDAIKLLKFAVG